VIPSRERLVSCANLYSIDFMRTTLDGELRASGT
jgi:hypothetical protein